MLSNKESDSTYFARLFVQACWKLGIAQKGANPLYSQSLVLSY